MDFSTLIPWICASLNCTSVTLDPWTLTELYNYAEEKLDVAARKFLLACKYDTSTVLATGQALYPLLPDSQATIMAAANGVMLKPSTVAEMEALDDGWESAPNGTPQRWVANAQGVTNIRAYPPPNATGVLTFIYQADSPSVTAAAPVIAMPTIMGDYLALRVLEQARLRQGDAQMLDCSKAFGNMASVIEKAFEAYWGGGEI
jgi:hypothetical protein